MNNSFQLICISLLFLINLGFKVDSDNYIEFNNKPFQITISVKDTVYIGESISLTMSFKNISDEIQYIRREFCPGVDGVPIVTDLNNKEIVRAISIQPVCVDNFIEIKTNDGLDLIFPYTLDEWYNLRKEGTYKVHLEYYGHLTCDEIQNEEVAKKLTIKSNTVYFNVLKRK
jgi:hypothetical protein